MNEQKTKSNKLRNDFVKKITASLTTLFFVSSFLLVPSNQAKADFKPLADPSSVAAFQELCNDVGLVINLTRTYRKLFSIKTTTEQGPQSGISAYLADEADYIPKMCSLIMAVSTASNTAGVLRAARIANQVAELDYGNQLDAIEDTIDIADFVQNLSKVKDSKDLKYKLLNASNHTRIIRYLQSFGLTDGSDGLAEMSAARDAQGQMENVARQLFSGCKVPLKKNESPSPGEIKDADGKIMNPAVAAALADRKVKALQKASEALAESNAAHKLLNKMIANVAESPEEVRSDSQILSRFRTEAIWLSFGFVPPQSSSKVGVEVVIQDCPKDEVRLKPRVKDGKIVVCKQTSESNAFYSNQGSVDGAQCSRSKKPEYEATTWMVKNMPILADRYYLFQTLASAVGVCPYGGVDAAMGEFTIDDLKPVTDEALAEQIKEKNLKTLEANCEKKDLDEQFKRLSKLGSIGEEDVSAWGYNTTTTPCRPTRQQIADSAVTVYVKNKNINNMRDFVKIYSERFSRFANLTYSLALTDNPVSKALRYAGGKLQRGLAELSTASSSSRWDPEAGLRTTNNQAALNNTWRKFSACGRPATLKRRYPNEFRNAIPDGEEMRINDERLVTLKKRCVTEEGQSPNGKIFEDTFYAMMDAMVSYFTAQQTVVQIDLRLGKYRGGYSDKDKIVCDQNLNITDITLANAQATVRMYEELANANRYNREQADQAKADKLELQKAHDEYQTVLTMATELKNRELARLMLNKIDVNNSKNPDFKGMTPNLMNQREREKHYINKP